MTIPKVIYQTWKDKNLPVEIHQIREKIKKLNPSYELILYDDIDIENFIINNYDNEVLQVFKKLNIGAGKADFWRYLILYKYGGIYLDIDADIIKNLDNLIKDTDSALITREKNKGVFMQWCLIFEKEHPILQRVIEKCISNIKKRVSNDLVYL